MYSDIKQQKDKVVGTLNLERFNHMLNARIDEILKDEDRARSWADQCAKAAISSVINALCWEAVSEYREGLMGVIHDEIKKILTPEIMQEMAQIYTKSKARDILNDLKEKMEEHYE